MTNSMQSLAKAITLGVVLVTASMPVLAESGRLTIASYGGAYARSQVIAFIDPFRSEHGMWVEVIDYDGGIDELADQSLSLNVKWDVVDMTAADVIQACEEGLLERLDNLQLEPAADGTPAREDFIEGSLLPCAVGQNVWSTVIAYDGSAFTAESAPTSLDDFFDVERFPGSRGLQKTPRVNLEWALLSTGVAPSDVYRMLETDSGLNQAFGALDRIKDSIVWWTNGEEPRGLLRNRRVAMSSVWSGRAFFHNRLEPGSLGTIWDANVWEREYWAVPKGAPDPETARAFIRFATQAERQAAQANVIAYSPARRSAMAMVESDVLPYLPTTTDNAAQGFAADAAWWARNQQRVQAVFDDWLEGGERRSFYTSH